MDRAFRPDNFDSYIGQKEIVSNLKIYVKSSKIRNKPLDHILFTGPAGLGKTSIANVVANEMGVSIKVVNATTIKSKGEIISIIASMNKNDILFLDEIHALDDRVAEVLYTAMEDFSIDLPVEGEAVRLNFEPFTLLGATTVAGMISKPLLDRFGEVMNMTPYSSQEIAGIISRSFSLIGINCGPHEALELAKRTRGIPRLANRLVRRVQDFYVACEYESVTSELIDIVCNSMGIDSNGLDKSSRAYLKCIKTEGKPVGISTLSSLINESLETIENNIEPFLLQMGYVTKTGRGRVLTASGLSYLLAS